MLEQGQGGLRAEGVWYPCTDIIDNTQLFHVMTAAAGVPQDSPLTVKRQLARRCGVR